MVEEQLVVLKYNNDDEIETNSVKGMTIHRSSNISCRIKSSSRKKIGDREKRERQVKQKIFVSSSNDNNSHESCWTSVGKTEICASEIFQLRID